MCFNFSDANPETSFNLRGMGNVKNIASTIWRFLNKYCLLIILPLSFVFFGLNKYPHLISFSAATEATLYSFFTLLLLYFVPRFKYDHLRSLLIASFLGILFLFYRNIINTVISISLLKFIDYSPVNIGIFTFLSIIFIYYLGRISDKKIQNIYKNVSRLFLLLFSINIFVWIGQTSLTSPRLIKVDSAIFKQVQQRDTPDVYFILFDEYCGFKSMKHYHNYENNEFVSKLKDLNFFVAKNPSSNYNRTWLTCPSLLEMNYLNNLESKDLLSNRIYLLSQKEIYENNIFSFFNSKGYKTINNSFFNIKSDYTNTDIVINIKKNVLIKNTLFEYAKSSFLNHIPSDYIQSVFDTKMAEYFKYNESVLKYFKSMQTFNDGSPKFSYTHFLMPHAPFLFANNKPRNFREAYLTNSSEESNRYVDYVEHANNVAVKLIQLILEKNKNSIIILTSDHAHRFKNNLQLDFNNFFAIYKPDQNYTGFTDSINSVNIFRTLLNNQFGQTLPILDSRKQDVLNLD